MFSVIPISSSAADGTVTVNVDDEVWYMTDDHGLDSVVVTCSSRPTLYVYQNETEFAITQVRMYFRVDPVEYKPMYYSNATVDFYVDMEYQPTSHYTTQTITYEKVSNGWGDVSFGNIFESSNVRKADIVAITYPSTFYSPVEFTCNFDYYGKDVNGTSIASPDWYGLWFTLEEVKTLAGY